ncbi:DUF2567 domain-containing protein [Skermania piniformis]|uniref:DUF2567 domain-containing protein n=1 Tax=Skermania pinensis TaxID=39122 RepID=A0ABX8SDZ3_9ACTN|nr:DUF2567 domain-containing protein [Skermania piniformis]QXQ15137.1 DUF2567 domain-containing protein [Skermania piniformis]
MTPPIRAAARVFAGCVLLSVLGAVVWALSAPPEQVLVVGPDRGRVLTGESDHLFDAVGVFCCIAAVVAVWSAAAAWQWRAMRGPAQVVGVLIGSGVGAFTMAVVGQFAARLRFPRIDDPAVDTVISHPPTLDTTIPLLVQPLIAGMVMLIFASLNTRDDLGVGDLAVTTPAAAGQGDREKRSDQTKQSDQEK